MAHKRRLIFKRHGPRCSTLEWWQKKDGEDWEYKVRYLWNRSRCGVLNIPINAMNKAFAEEAYGKQT